MWFLRLFRYWGDSWLRQDNARLNEENERLLVQHRIAQVELESMALVNARNHERVKAEIAEWTPPPRNPQQQQRD